MRHRHDNAGASALRRYEDGLRRWRALVRAKVALVTAPMIAAGVAAAVLGGAAWDFAGGLVAGAGLAMAAWVWESPPRYVEQWRDGSQGERRTAARLRRLEHDGWVLLHDVPGPFGNRDHIAIGPAGLFLIDSKVRFGDVEVVGDELLCHRLGGEFDYRTNLGGPMRGAAAALYRDLRVLTPGAVFVQAVVAVWARFPEEVAEGDRVTFVHGDRLAGWLSEQPRRLADARVDELVAAVQQIAAPLAA